jgi:hypothetical protein
MLAPAESAPWITEAILSICAENERIDHRNATRLAHKPQPTKRPPTGSPRWSWPSNSPCQRQTRDPPTDRPKLHNQLERRCLGSLASTLRQRLTMRLSDAGLHQRQTKALYLNHRLPPWLIEYAAPRSLEPIVRRHAESFSTTCE